MTVDLLPRCYPGDLVHEFRAYLRHLTRGASPDEVAAIAYLVTEMGNDLVRAASTRHGVPAGASPSDRYVLLEVTPVGRAVGAGRPAYDLAEAA